MEFLKIILNLTLNLNSVFESPNKGISKSNAKDPYLGFKMLLAAGTFSPTQAS